MAKKIVLLADGTGNGLRVQVSNIARIMEALEISQDQVVCYIPGVGTESFLPLAWLDSATGFGVPANVRRLYWFLSWHWEPDCEIYMFGFSRGAFTIRLLIEFIAKRGLLPRIHGSQLHRERAVRAAWNAFQATSETASKNLVHRLSNKIIYLFRLLSRYFYRSRFDYYENLYAMGRHDVSIAFVGLFDTVDALGVPIEELRAVIHLLFFPVKFLDDHTIPRNVCCVRHALSLDDERLTFQPIRIAREPNPSPGRIQEVWFAGVHSDVGGGYPDDMAAHVPLCWLLQEAFNSVEQDPLRVLKFHPGALERFNELATPFGPLHSSRSGAGRIYRWAQRVNTLHDAVGNPYCNPIVHFSVIERLVDPNYDYQPLLITKQYAVWMPSGFITRPNTEPKEVARKVDSEFNSTTVRRVEPELGLVEGAIESLGTPAPVEMEIALNYVWLNRIGYYFFVALFITVLALPVIAPVIEDFNKGIWSQISVVALPFQWLLRVLGPIGDALSRFLSGFENVLRGVGDIILSFTPTFLYAHVETALNHPFFCIALGLYYFLLRQRSDWYQNAIRYHARLAWNIKNDKIKEGPTRAPSPTSNIVRELRNLFGAGSVLGVSRAILGYIYAIAFIFVPVLVAANRIGFNYLAGSGSVCEGSSLPEWVSRGSGRFTTSDPCWASGWMLEHGAVYRLTISIDPKSDDPWLDQLMLTDPYGFDSKGWVQTAGVALRRWPSAAWFHPIARIGARGISEWPLVPIDGGGALSPRGRRCSVLPLNYSETAEHKSFCANHPGVKSCVDGGLSLSIDPLPADELDAAKTAWARDSYSYDGKSCDSVFPRKTFVSEFVASDTGELFLFVNDAAHVSLDGRKQIFYDNNTGTAKVTIERLPRDAARATTASAP